MIAAAVEGGFALLASVWGGRLADCALVIGGGIGGVQAAIDIDPHLAIAYATLGSVYYSVGDSEKADAFWRSALELEPEYSEVRGALSLDAPPAEGRPSR